MKTTKETTNHKDSAKKGAPGAHDRGASSPREKSGALGHAKGGAVMPAKGGAAVPAKSSAAVPAKSGVNGREKIAPQAHGAVRPGSAFCPP